MHKLKRILIEELDEYAKKGSISSSDLEVINMLTDAVKDMYEIDMLKDGYHRKYERDDYDDYDEKHYHHREEHMVERIEEMMEEAKNAREKDILKRCLAEMRNN